MIRVYCEDGHEPRHLHWDPRDDYYVCQCGFMVTPQIVEMALSQDRFYAASKASTLGWGLVELSDVAGYRAYFGRGGRARIEHMRRADVDHYRAAGTH